jgi:spermidine/putrescine transport system permease protein
VPAACEENAMNKLRDLVARFPLIEIVSILIILFIYLPVLVLIVFSFNTSKVGVFPLEGFTLEWYRELIRDPRFAETTKNSLIVATIATLISAVMGVAAAFGIVRHRSKLNPLLSGLFLAPLLYPSMLLAISLLSFFTFLGIRLSLLTVTLGHLVTSIPFYFLILSSRLRGFDTSIEEAARDLGANRAQAFQRVTLPLIWPSILGCAIIVFATSVDNFVVTFFTIGAQSTLPLLIWSMMKRGVAPSINAISTVLLLVTFVAAVLADRYANLKMDFF